MSRKNQPEKDTKGRGGYRDNAGRKSSWKHSDTCTIRIPKSFAKRLVEIARQLDNGEKIDIDTKSILPGSDSVTESKGLEVNTLSDLSFELEPSGKFDIDTESNFPGNDSVTNSHQLTEEPISQFAHHSAQDQDIDIDTESLPQVNDIDTESILNLDESTLSQSIPELKVAIVQAKNILKAKKSARRSLARLLSTLYSTTVSFDDLK